MLYWPLVPPGSQISILFALRPAIFELQAILRQAHRLTPKWLWMLKGQRYPIYMLQLLSLKFHSLPLQPADFELQAILKQAHRMTPKWHWTIKGQRYPIYHVKIPWLSNVTAFRSMISYFQDIGNFFFSHWPTINYNLFFLNKFSNSKLL